MSDTMVTLISKDKQRFTIQKEFAIKSPIIKKLVEEEDCVLSASISSATIPRPCIHLFDIHSETLALVVEFLNVQDENDQKKIVERLEMSATLGLVNAASFLDMKEMVDIACQRAADLLKGKRTEEIKEIFNIKSDFTPEEEETIGVENAWAFN